MQLAQLTLEQAVAPACTLDELLNGITTANLHNEIDFGLAQAQEQF